MTTATLKAYHGKPKIRDKYLRRVRAHRKADQIVQGYGYWSDGKGCAVGCTIHGESHAAYETELGIPQIVARLEDRIFEGLPKLKARDWPVRFLASIKCGADLSMIWPVFAEWLMFDETHGVLKYAKWQQTKDAITTVGELYREWIKTGTKPEIERWRKARAAAAAYAAAAAAADADAAAAAYAAAYAAAAADADAAAAADAAAYAAAAADADAAAARHKFWVAASEKLIELLSASKPAKRVTAP